MVEIEKNVTLTNALGLHARAAAQFVKCAGCFDCEISVKKDEQVVNGKNILGLLMLALPKGVSFDIHAKGEDAEDAINALYTLVNDKFGENE